MPAYLIAEIEVTDPAAYEGYKQLSPGAIAAHGGRFLVRGGDSVLLEGAPAPGRMVVLEFPDLASITRFYDSVEYRAAREARQGAAVFRSIAVEGV